jgi:uncharacterized Zn finger protein
MTIPMISISQIRNLATRSSYERGQEYYQSGAIQNPVRRDDRLEAECEGSHYEPYRVYVRLGGSQGVLQAGCTCEYSFEGYCKHIVALLLTWLHKSEAFAAREAPTAILAKYSKESLIEIVGHMLARHPDLHDLLDQPPATQKRPTKSVNLESFRKQIRKVIRGFQSYDDYGDGRNLGSTLSSVIRTAQDYANHADYVNASALARMILDELFQDDDAYLNMDEDGWLSEQVDNALNTLYRCLEHLRADDAERLLILNALVKTKLFDMQVGGMDIGADSWDYLLRFAQPSEMAALRAQIEAAKPRLPDQSFSTQWTNTHVQEMLADLDIISGADPDTVLNRLREAEEWSLLFSRLISLKRIDEAVAVIEKYLTHAYERLQHLDELVTAGQEGTAIRLAETTLQKQYDRQLGSWLLERLERIGDYERKLHWSIVRLKSEPSIGYYTATEEQAVKLGQWDKLRPQLIAWLEQHKHFSTLTRVRLHERDYELAWDVLGKVLRSARNDFQGEQLELEVADQSREALPEKAVPIYIKHIRANINRRNRQYYAQAAQQLSIVRELYDRMDEFEKWEHLIAGIRKEFPRLPALHDELRKLKL